MDQEYTDRLSEHFLKHVKETEEPWLLYLLDTVSGRAVNHNNLRGVAIETVEPVLRDLATEYFGKDNLTNREDAWHKQDEVQQEEKKLGFFARIFGGRRKKGGVKAQYGHGEDLENNIKQFGEPRFFRFRFRGETLLAKKLDDDRVIFASISSKLMYQNMREERMVAALLDMLTANTDRIEFDQLSSDLKVNIRLYGELDLGSGQIENVYEPEGHCTRFIVDERMGADLKQFFKCEFSTPPGLNVRTLDGEHLATLDELEFDTLRHSYFFVRLRFNEEKVLSIIRKKRAVTSSDWNTIHKLSNDMLRDKIRDMLASGLKTFTSPFPENAQEFQNILDELGEFSYHDLTNRLRVGGFLDHPVEMGGIEQRCMECIYYLPNKKWCDLPELPVPVEPEWWCRLWKI